ncbi:MAG: hypothetical protein V4808_07105 [Pseudomonadota bacterium]
MGDPRVTLSVSDHALLRFLSDVAGVDVEAARADLAASFARPQAIAQDFGARRYLIKSDGMIYVVRDGVLSTIVPDNGPRSRFDTLTQRHGRG